MTIFCNQLFLALTDETVVVLTDASVKVVLYKRCTFCPVFFALSTTEEASHSWGETFGRSEASKAGVWETIGRIKILCAELEKNLRRFVGRFSNVRLPAVHAASNRLPVHVPQASSDPALQLILRFGLPTTPVNVCLQESPKVLNWAGLRDNGGFDSGAAHTGSQAHFL